MHSTTIGPIKQHQQRLALCVAILGNDCHLIFADDLSSVTIRPRFVNCRVGRWFRFLSDSNHSPAVAFSCIENQNDGPFPTRFAGKYCSNSIQIKLPICFLPDLSLFGWHALNAADRNKFYSPLFNGAGQVTCALDWSRIETAHRYEAFLNVEIDSVRQLPKWTLDSAEDIFGFSKTRTKIGSFAASNSSSGIVLKIGTEKDQVFDNHYLSVIIRRHAEGRMAFGRSWQQNLSVGDTVDFVSIEASCASTPLLLALDIAKNGGHHPLNADQFNAIEHDRDEMFILRVPLTVQLLSSLRPGHHSVGTLQLANFGTLFDPNNVIGQKLDTVPEHVLREKLLHHNNEGTNFHVSIHARLCMLPEMGTKPLWYLVGVPSVEKTTTTTSSFTKTATDQQQHEHANVAADHNNKLLEHDDDDHDGTGVAVAAAPAPSADRPTTALTTIPPPPLLLSAPIGADAAAIVVGVEQQQHNFEEVRLDLEQEALVLFTHIAGWDLHMRFFDDREGRFTRRKCCNRRDLPSNYADIPPEPGSWARIVYTEDSPLSVRHIVIRLVCPMCADATPNVLGATLNYAMRTVCPANEHVWSALLAAVRPCTVQKLVDQANAALISDPDEEEDDGIGDEEDQQQQHHSSTSLQRQQQHHHAERVQQQHYHVERVQQQQHHHHQQQSQFVQPCVQQVERDVHQPTEQQQQYVRPGVQQVECVQQHQQVEPSHALQQQVHQVERVEPLLPRGVQKKPSRTIFEDTMREMNSSSSCSDALPSVSAMGDDAEFVTPAESFAEAGPSPALPVTDDAVVDDDFASDAAYPDDRHDEGGDAVIAAEDDGWGKQSPTEWEHVVYDRSYVPPGRRQTRRSRNGKEDGTGKSAKECDNNKWRRAIMAPTATAPTFSCRNNNTAVTTTTTKVAALPLGCLTNGGVRAGATVAAPVTATVAVDDEKWTIATRRRAYRQSANSRQCNSTTTASTGVVPIAQPSPPPPIPLACAFNNNPTTTGDQLTKTNNKNTTNYACNFPLPPSIIYYYILCVLLCKCSMLSYQYFFENTKSCFLKKSPKMSKLIN